jgi:hypothetical protein
MNGISKKYKTVPWSILYGYVFLPSDMEGEKRDQYIAKCKRKSRVSLLFEDGGGVCHDCYVIKSAISDIEFPDIFGKVGSCVICYVDPNSGLPIVMGVLGKEDESELLGEKEKRLIAQSGNNIAEVGVKGKTGEIYLNVNSDQSTGGVVTINVSNTNRSGKLKIRVIGDVDMYVKDECEISSEEQIGLTVTDVENDNIHSIIIDGNGVNIDGNVSTDNDGNVKVENEGDYSVECDGDIKLNPDGEIILNNNARNSYMVDINNLVNKINLLENKVNDLVGQMNTLGGHTHGGVTSGGSATSPPVTVVITDLVNTTVDDVRDPNIKN